MGNIFIIYNKKLVIINKLFNLWKGGKIEKKDSNCG